jgi:hypothetical protein
MIFAAEIQFTAAFMIANKILMMAVHPLVVKAVVVAQSIDSLVRHSRAQMILRRRSCAG